MPACLWGPRIPRQPRPQASPLSHRYYLLQNRMRKSRKAQGGPAAPSRFSPDTLSRTTTLPAGAHLPSLPSIGLGSVATGQPGRDHPGSGKADVGGARQVGPRGGQGCGVRGGQIPAQLHHPLTQRRPKVQSALDKNRVTSLAVLCCIGILFSVTVTPRQKLSDAN